MTPLAALLADLATGPAGPVHRGTGAPFSQAERDLLAWATPSELRFAQHELADHAAPGGTDEPQELPRGKSCPAR